jgi:hypothetical protein
MRGKKQESVDIAAFFNDLMDEHFPPSVHELSDQNDEENNESSTLPAAESAPTLVISKKRGRSSVSEPKQVDDEEIEEKPEKKRRSITLKFDSDPSPHLSQSASAAELAVSGTKLTAEHQVFLFVFILYFLLILF